MAAAGATFCSAGKGPQNEKKNVGEILKYLTSRSDRARFWRREGSVLEIDMVALRQEMDKENAGQRQQKGIAVRYCSCGAAYLSRVQRGGDRDARRKRQRANRERLRDNRTVSRILAQSLSSIQGGSDSRNPETIGELHLLQRIAVPNEGKKLQIWQTVPIRFT